MADDTVTVFGVEIEPGKTKVYRDDKGRLRIQHIVIAKPRTHDGGELPDTPGAIGVVESINDDGTVTVRVGDE